METRINPLVPGSAASVILAIETVAVSLSVVLTLTISLARGSKKSLERASSTAMVMVEAMLPSTIRSSTPVTVTLWATFQSPVVKVSEAALTVASPGSEAVIENTTSEVGWRSSTTVKVPVVPVSDTVIGPPATVKLATSLSVMVLVALAGIPSVAAPEMIVSRVTIMVSGPSTSASLMTGMAMVAVLLPATTVTVPASAVKSVPEVAVPVTV